MEMQQVVALARIVTPLLAAWLLALSASPAGASSTAATLTILAPPVEHVRGGGARQAATPGMNLREGDRIVTGAGGLALLTFLDGSTVTILPESDVGVVPPRDGDAGRSRFAILIHAGKVWARIARLLGSQSAVALQSNEYAATARDGLIGAERTRGGGFVCWTRAGDLTLADATGRVLAVVPAERKATVEPGGDPTVQPFRVNASALRVTTSGPALPMVQMPGGRGDAGFAAGGDQVNHVFGALTAQGAAHRLIEVPGGAPGPYTLLLRGLGAGPFTVEVEGSHLGVVTYRHRLSGTIGPGEVLATRIEQRLASEGAHDPRTARAEDARIAPLRPWPGSSASGRRLTHEGESHFVGGR
jgi:hypothetical protein